MARILVVDDEPDVRELFNITLKMAGHVTETAKDGVEALERLQNGDSPELILLDLMMPRLDGFGLLSQIRQNLDTRPFRVLVATAKVLEDADNQKLASWPVVGVLNKGELDITAMVTIISTALSKEPHKPKTEGELPKEEPKPTEVKEAPKPAEAAVTSAPIPSASSQNNPPAVSSEASKASTPDSGPQKDASSAPKPDQPLTVQGNGKGDKQDEKK